MSLTLTPLHAALQAGPARTLPFVLAFAAPDVPAPAHRVPLNVAVVIDASPSMGGAPLEQAKAAAITFIDRLQPTDRLAVIAYSTAIEVLAESAPVGTNRDQARQRIAALQVLGGGTYLQGGWLKGAEAVAPHVNDQSQTRVLLLSDGQANHGEHRPAILAEHAAQLLNAGIVTSTYGLGQGFNEDLMTQLGHAGGGQAFYAEDAEQLAGYFDAEFRLMEGAVARHLEVQAHATLTPSTDTVALTWANARGTGAFGARLGDVAVGSASWVLGQVALPDTFIGQSLTLRATVRYRDAQGQVQEQHLEQVLPVALEAGPADVTVAARADELEAARIQRQAREDAARGNWRGVDANLDILRGLAAAGNNAYINQVSASLTSLSATRNASAFSKEATYAASAMSTRSVALNEDHTTLATDRYGLRKAHQGKSSPSNPPQA